MHVHRTRLQTGNSGFGVPRDVSSPRPNRDSRSRSLYISVTKIDTEPSRHCFRSRPTEAEKTEHSAEMNETVTTESETDRDREARAR
jgi:hypothetical protein